MKRALRGWLGGMLKGMDLTMRKKCGQHVGHIEMQEFF